jgi:predicted nucleic acid-binding protein
MISHLHGKRLYVDANIIIYAVEGFEKYAGVSSDLLAAAEREQISVVTSELTLAEVIVVPHRSGLVDIVSAYDGFLRSRRSFEVVPVGRDVLALSGSLRASIGGKLPDAIHSATAIKSGCSHFVTADKSLKVPRELELIRLDDLSPAGDEDRHQ